MEAKALTLNVPESLYREWEQQPAQVRTAALQMAIQAMRDYLARQTGRVLLLQLPEEAEKSQDALPVDLADLHNDYLYEDKRGAA